MKIGILTLPLHTNYGGILQAWALQTILERLGHNVEVFTPKEKKRTPLILPLVWSVRITKRLLGKKTCPIFYEFREKNIIYPDYRIKIFIKERINLTPIRSLRRLPFEKYNAIVVGSDQIWRKVYCLHSWKETSIDQIFLNNLQDKKLIKLSYAASLGIDEWEFSPEETINIKKALQSYRAFSVREDSAVNLFKNHTNIVPDLVLDPTFLLKKEDYQNLYGDVYTTSNSIVSYILDRSDEKSAILNLWKEKLKIPLYELNQGDPKHPELSIEEWLSGIANAKIVITDSFHGCVFSLIFGKPVVILKNENRGNARFDSLIQIFGLHKNVWKGCSSDPEYYFLPVDINETLEEWRLKSYNFIKDALKSN